jgi:hypothetical protein
MIFMEFIFNIVILYEQILNLVNLTNSEVIKYIFIDYFLYFLFNLVTDQNMRLILFVEKEYFLTI